MLLPDRKLIRFGRSLAKHARRISDDDLGLLLEFEWRSRLTAAWLTALDRRTQFRKRLGTLLMEGGSTYAGEGYCLALARFGEAQDAAILSTYLDRYLPQVECQYSQAYALAALMHLDERLGTNHADRFLTPGGPAVEQLDPADRKAYMGMLCAFADACMTGTLDQWLPRRQQYLDRHHPI